MIRNRRLPWLLATTLLAASPQLANAATVVRTLGAVINLGNGIAEFDFADITGADQLVSIGGGTINSPEGSTFDLSVVYTDISTALLFSQSIGDLTGIPLANFAPVGIPTGNIKGLRFELDLDLGGLTIPAGTQFTFHAADAQTGVPEPIGWVMMVGGFAAAGAALRGRRRHTPAFKFE